MLGKGATFAAGALRRAGIDISQAQVDAEGYPALLREINREFGGQAAARAKTYIGQLEMQAIAWGELKESMGKGILPIVQAITPAITTAVNAFTALNEVSHGAAGIVIAVGAGLLTLGGIVTMTVPGLRILRDMWFGVAAGANAATAAQMRAGNAATAAAASATAAAAQGNAATAAVSTGAMATGAGAMAGGGVIKGGMRAAGARFGAFKAAGGGFTGVKAFLKGGAGAAAGSAAAGAGVLGKAGGLLKGFGPMLVAGIGGGMLESWGARGVERMKQGKGGGAAAAFGTVGGGALSGAATGALVGSIVPGVGTAIGAGVGALVGTIGGILRAKSASEEIAKARGSERKTPAVSEAKRHTTLLVELVKLTMEQNKLVIGGGERAGKLLTSGDVQRGLARVLTRGMA